MGNGRELRGLGAWAGTFLQSACTFILHPSSFILPSPLEKRARRRGFPGRGPFLIPDPKQALLGTRFLTFILGAGNPISRQILGQCRKTVRRREIGYAPCAAPLVPRLPPGNQGTSCSCSVRRTVLVIVIERLRRGGDRQPSRVAWRISGGRARIGGEQEGGLGGSDYEHEHESSPLPLRGRGVRG